MGIYMAREEPKFTFRMPPEIKEKLKVRAEMNGRSFNSELLKIVEEALAKPSAFSGYGDDSERLADQQSEVVKKMVFETLKDIYGRGKK